MAIIESSNLKVEVKFTDYAYDWVHYSFTFTYGSQPVFNPAITEKEYLFANDHRNDSLINTLEDALINLGLERWEPIEPDVVIEIKCWPELGWEVRQHDKIASCIGQKQQDELREVDRLRKELGGKHPKDYFELTFLVDVGGLKDLTNEKGDEYTAQHVGIRLFVIREALENFVKQLRQEIPEITGNYRDTLHNSELSMMSPEFQV